MKNKIKIIFRFISKETAVFKVSKLRNGYLVDNVYFKDKEEVKKDINKFIDELL